VNAARLCAFVGGFCARFDQGLPASGSGPSGNLSRSQLPAQSSDVKHPMISRMLRCERFFAVTFRFGISKKPKASAIQIEANKQNEK
jgi:hypothetical protein